MRLVESVEEIEAIILRLVDDLVSTGQTAPEGHEEGQAAYRRELNDLLRAGKNYVAAFWPSESIVFFAPSRFVGYADNELLTRLDGPVDGGKTDKRLEHLLGEPPVPNPELDELFVEFCEGIGATPYNNQRKYFPTVFFEDELGSTGAEDAATAEAQATCEKQSGQRFASSAEFRSAVEMRAMKVAADHFEGNGYTVGDTSANRPYDLVATHGDETLYVEVKGTTTPGEKVFLTKNEVAHAKEHPGECVLFVVHDITVRGDTAEDLVASGGEMRVMWPWSPDDEDLVALVYQYTLPGEA